MRNILKIFTTDVKRIGNNVVAVVVVMGLSILPALYAWFNIFSNWDPYEPAATSQLIVAVASDDKGASIMGASLNVGQSVVTALESNETIGWVFPESTEAAIEGVESSDYYAALIIPETFTEEMIGFLDGEVDKPTIYYYENDKKNGIAPKITGKAKTAVQEQVNATFLSTLAETILKAGNVLAVVDQDGNIQVTGTFDAVITELDNYIVMMQSFKSIMQSAELIMATSQAMLPDMDSMMENGRSTVISMQGMVNSSANAVDTMSDMVSSSMDMVMEGLNYLSIFTTGILDSMEDIGGTTDIALGMAIGLVEGLKTNMDVLETLLPDEQEAIHQISDSLDKILVDLKNVQTYKTQVDVDINFLRNEINREITACQKELNALSNEYNYVVRPSIKTTTQSLQKTFLDASMVLNATDVDTTEISEILDDYRETVGQGELSLDESIEIAQSLRDAVSDVKEEVNSLLNGESYDEILTALATDPTFLADFVSSPVRMDTVAIYPIEHYGSAASPFYTILAIWVGALFMVAIIHVAVKPIDEGDKYKTYERFFGRYIIFFIIGQTQTLLTILGNLYYIQIQCQHPFLYWLAASVASTAFTCFMYAVTFAFGNLGEGLAIIVMVIQVAGSGGTFPIETLPHVFQVVYRFLPFQFGMKAFKECIAGMYELDYWKNVGKMLLFLLFSLLLGLLMERPFRPVNHMIEKSKEGTGLMI